MLITWLELLAMVLFVAAAFLARLTPDGRGYHLLSQLDLDGSVHINPDKPARIRFAPEDRGTTLEMRQT